MKDNPWHHASPDAAISEQTKEMIAAMQLILWFKRDRSYNNQRFRLYKRKKEQKHTEQPKKRTTFYENHNFVHTSTQWNGEDHGCSQSKRKRKTNA